MAFISDVDICNMALSNIGASSNIESLDEDSVEANTCKLWYDFSRKQALETHDWSFARTRLTLATHAEDPPDGVWDFRYVYPSDCLKLQKIQNPAGEKAQPIPFSVEVDDAGEEKSVLTDLDDAIGVYTYDNEKVHLYTAFAVEFVAAILSSRIAFTLTGKTSVRKDMRDHVDRMRLIAPASDANERKEREPREASWIEGR